MKIYLCIPSFTYKHGFYAYYCALLTMQYQKFLKVHVCIFENRDYLFVIWLNKNPNNNYSIMIVLRKKATIFLKSQQTWNTHSDAVISYRQNYAVKMCKNYDGRFWEFLASFFPNYRFHSEQPDNVFLMIKILILAHYK